MWTVKHLDVRPELLIRVYPVDEDIFCLNISMNDVEIMKCVESTQELLDDENDLIHVEAWLPEHVLFQCA